MPFAREITFDSDARVCLWQITETEDELQALTEIDLSHLHSPSRRLETLAVHAMLRQVTGRRGLVIGHDENGRPTLPDCHISVSHTRGWAALAISPDKRVGVDVEYMADRVLRITDRFIRQDEQKESVERQLVCWCAKEAVYKYYSEEHLEYFEMRLQPYPLAQEGSVLVDNLKSHRQVMVRYEIHPTYVLAYAIEP